MTVDALVNRTELAMPPLLTHEACVVTSSIRNGARGSKSQCCRCFNLPREFPMTRIYINRERLLGCLAASLLGFASIVHADVVTAAAANQRDAAAGEQQTMQQASPSDPIVLRGTRPAPAPAPRYGSSGNKPTWIVAPWFVPQPATGFDDTLDRSGLSPPGGIMNLGPYWGE
jgi:hypothetical protein